MRLAKDEHMIKLGCIVGLVVDEANMNWCEETLKKAGCIEV